MISGTLLRADGAVDAILVQPELEDAKLRCQVHEEAEGAQESTPGSIHKYRGCDNNDERQELEGAKPGRDQVERVEMDYRGDPYTEYDENQEEYRPYHL